ncbi:hypothetical protein [Methylococcus capsulatus]|jgi:hypothetical protein|uniref:hypothetical protein n=1 Tax=Methylococcus capsulatus TaxID=414 RepID=UPI001C529940|nr:hypothetical protein [Methylococcus capsulatus]QXP89479.1 hypothetical protein KW114_10185 [Methylococcus capsulatus]
MRERGWTKGDALKVAEIFRDYWVAKSGADARKADWGATWRNWVRREGLRPKMPQSARAPWPAYRAEPVRENPRRLIL